MLAVHVSLTDHNAHPPSLIIGRGPQVRVLLLCCFETDSLMWFYHKDVDAIINLDVVIYPITAQKQHLAVNVAAACIATGVCLIHIFEML